MTQAKTQAQTQITEAGENVEQAARAVLALSHKTPHEEVLGTLSGLIQTCINHRNDDLGSRKIRIIRQVIRAGIYGGSNETPKSITAFVQTQLEKIGLDVDEFAAKTIAAGRNDEGWQPHRCTCGGTDCKNRLQIITTAFKAKLDQRAQIIQDFKQVRTIADVRAFIEKHIEKIDITIVGRDLFVGFDGNTVGVITGTPRNDDISDLLRLFGFGGPASQNNPFINLPPELQEILRDMNSRY